MKPSVTTGRPGPAGMRYLSAHTGTEPLDITVVLRRRAGAAPAVAAWPHTARTPRAEFAQQCGADPADLASLRHFARQHALNETGADLSRRVLHLRATPAALQSAFAVTLGNYQLADGRGPFICLRQPAALPTAGDGGAGPGSPPGRAPAFPPAARHPGAAPTRRRRSARCTSSPPARTAADRTSPSSSSAAGFSTADLATYFKGLGHRRRRRRSPRCAVAGGANTPGGDADGEVMLDIEVIGALAPRRGDRGVLRAQHRPGLLRGDLAGRARQRAPHGVISISWGGPEDELDAAARTAHAECARGCRGARVTRDGGQRRHRLERR